MVRNEDATAQVYANPAKIQHSLKGAHYPSHKSDLVRLAKSNSAPSDVMDALAVLPNKAYASPADLMKEIGKKE
ncbi:MAG: DUF2795 domain-containing protein [Nitrososphaerota archaeon]|nr:DUF2795 domain-containing protein [Nitrososphaerota archaeon]